MSPSESSCSKAGAAAKPLTALGPGTQAVVKSVQGGPVLWPRSTEGRWACC